MSVKVCAHRGASGTHPENTAAAYDEAVRLGCEMMEFDVRRTVDGQFIIMHDPTVDRTTDGTGAVADLTFDAIRALDAGEGQRVPALDEALAYADRLMLNIHAYPVTDADIEPMAAAILDGLRNVDHRRWFVACLVADMLTAVTKLDGEARLCPLLAQRDVDYINRARAIAGCCVLQPMNAIVTPRFVAEAHEHGLKVNPFYADDEAEMRRLIACDVDGILTNQPARLMAVRSS
jgi:glycerophosphoryl diester phosphodiesterase